MAILSRFVSSEQAEAILAALEQAGLLDLTDYGNAEINAVIEQFKQVFGTTKASRYDRYAASRLIKRHGLEMIKAVILALAARSHDKYSPTVSSISQLEEKWVNVIKFLQLGNTPELEL